MIDIFCPKCSELILDEPTCRPCGWRRPVTDESVAAPVWCADLGTRLSKPRCYPTVAPGLYCLGTEDGTLLALDITTGELVWDLALGQGRVADFLTTDGERLFVGCQDVEPIPTPGQPFMALDARTGQELWRFPTDAHSLSAAAVEAGTVYFTTSAGLLHALDAASGEERWAVQHPLWGPAPPAVGAGILCVGGRGNTLVAYDTRDGHELWRFNADGWFASQPLISGGRVHAVSWDDHLYTLDDQGGHLLWKHKGERGNGLTTPPVATSGHVLVGSRVYRETDGERTGGYALLALDAEDGVENWRFYTDTHIFTPPAVADRQVFCGSRDGFFYAIDATTGLEHWRVQVTSRAVTRSAVAQDLVIFGGRDGIIHAVRWRARPDDRRLDPHAHVQEGQYAEAAIAYALQGEFAEAAAIFEGELDRPQEAARLYERAGLPGVAAALWEEVDQLKRARDLYRDAGDKPGLARVLEGMGQPLQAARLHEELGDLEGAARLYEDAGDRPAAAELYARVGKHARGVVIWASLGRWEQQVESLIDDGRPGEAARILEDHDRLARAAELYLEASDLDSALRVERNRGQWESVADLALRLGNQEQAAMAYERLGDASKAAEAFRRAAEHQAAAESPDAERIAALYERAAKQYETLYREKEMLDCHREVRRFRQLPELVVRGRADEPFIEYQWNVVRLEVENAGFGPARNIRVELSDNFETPRPEEVAGLPRAGRRALAVHARPREGEVGARVPLDIIVTYEDVRGRNYRLTQVESVPVVKAGRGLLDRETPLEVHIHGDMIEPGAKKVAGDEVQSGAQKGDRVEISRGAGSGVSLASCDTGDRVEIHRDGSAVRRCPDCNLPIRDEEQQYCPDCGAPLEGEGKSRSRGMLADADE